MNAGLRISESIALIRNIKTTGTITPSSSSLIRELISSIDFSNTNCIVELGSGTGCVTRSLLQRMQPGSKLICLEVDDEFVCQLNNIVDEKLCVYNACATTIRSILDELNIAEVDYIVSSLPLALMKYELLQNILASAKANLKQGGRFLQYQYSLKNLGDVKPHFRQVKLRFTLRNMPPAFVYDCIK